uniref:limulus clotting factor C n=1 Tax=Strigamia maritima TaxID=126957 RepID=T1J0D6_STRMM
CAKTDEQDFSGRQVRPLLPFPVREPTGLTKKPLIVGGKNSLSNSRPWMVAILDRGPGDVLARFFCGASLIGPRHVVTAAHCFIGRTLDAREIEILMGAHNLAMAGSHDVDKITLHPGFSESVWYNDIAIIRLRNRVSFGTSIRPICLPPPTARNKKFLSTMTTVAGWGRIKFDGDLSEQLQEVNLPVVPNPQCNDTLLSIRGTRRRYPRGITDTIICAGSDTPKDACEGDSGGPMFIPDRLTQHWLLIGVVSTGFQCAVPGIPAIYTRITSYIDWINQNLNE